MKIKDFTNAGLADNSVVAPSEPVAPVAMTTEKQNATEEIEIQAENATEEVMVAPTNAIQSDAPTFDYADSKDLYKGLGKRPKRKYEKFEDIPAEVIESFKRKYGRIFSLTFQSDKFIVRTVPRDIYTQGMLNSTAELTQEDLAKEHVDSRNQRIYTRQEFFASQIVLWPEDAEWLLRENAGYAASITDEAILRSGFEIPTSEEL